MATCNNIQSLLLSFVITLVFVRSVLPSIHSRLRHFEVITPQCIRTRIKRSLDTGKVLKKTLKFHALGKQFHIELTPGWSVVDARDLNCKMMDSTGNANTFEVKTDNIFSGFVKGEERTSEVDAFRLRRVWTAHIHTSGEDYTLDPFNHHDQGANPTQMVIFKSNNFISGNVSHVNNIDAKFHDTFDNLPNATCLRKHDGPRFRSIKLNQTLRSRDEHRHAATSVFTGGNPQKRVPRSSRGGYPTICDLQLIMDHYTFKDYGHLDPHYSTRKLLYWAQRVNRIYRKTKFGTYTNMGFRVRSIVLMTGFSPEDSVMGWNSPVNGARGGEELTIAMSRNESFSDYCLVHMTTTRPIAAGTMGAGYTAYTRGISGLGICGYTDNPTHPNRNVGWSTFMLKGEDLGEERYIVTLAHELGHNWGALHDRRDIKRCQPDDKRGGKFIMLATVNAGTLPNSHLFSPCSQRYIRKVLDKIAYDCFLVEDSEAGYCGDGVVDADEECDDGMFRFNTPRELGVSCCTDRCRIRAGAECSPTSSPCCSTLCTIANTSQTCWSDQARECWEISHCDGVKHAVCPLPRARHDNTLCADEGLCHRGRCVTYCERLGQTSVPAKVMLPCSCQGSRRDMCRVCCVDQASNLSCVATDIVLVDGTLCSNQHMRCHEGRCKAFEFVLFKHPLRNVFLLDDIPIYVSCFWLVVFFIMSFKELVEYIAIGGSRRRNTYSDVKEWKRRGGNRTTSASTPQPSGDGKESSEVVPDLSENNLSTIETIQTPTKRPVSSPTSKASKKPRPEPHDGQEASQNKNNSADIANESLALDFEYQELMGERMITGDVRDQGLSSDSLNPTTPDPKSPISLQPMSEAGDSQPTGSLHPSSPNYIPSTIESVAFDHSPSTSS